MSHRKHQPEGYEARLHEYMDRELHPETAQHIGELVTHSELLSAEMAMAVIIQMQLDHLRKDDDLNLQAEQASNVYRLPDHEGEALPPR